MAEQTNNIVFLASAVVAVLVPTSSYIYMQGQNNQISTQLVEVSHELNISVKNLSLELNALNAKVKAESLRSDYHEQRITGLEIDAKQTAKELSYLAGEKEQQ